MFPSGTIQSGLENLIVGQGNTTIQFPYPGAMTPDRPKRSKTDEAHASTFGFAYANDLAREFLVSKRGGRLPIESIIVREKLRARDSTTAEVLVVMLKRESGFNQKANDWEFLTISGDLKKIVEREKEGKCVQCHASEAKNDLVFRYPAR
jgi:hypothetical protein